MGRLAVWDLSWPSNFVVFSFLDIPPRETDPRSRSKYLRADPGPPQNPSARTSPFLLGPNSPLFLGDSVTIDGGCLILRLAANFRLVVLSLPQFHVGTADGLGCLTLIARRRAASAGPSCELFNEDLGHYPCNRTHILTRMKGEEKSTGSLTFLRHLDHR